MWGNSSWSPPLGHEVLPASAPDLGCGVAPLGCAMCASHSHPRYEKDIQDQDNHDGVITHLEPNILECEVSWALESITTNKASGGDGMSAELFQILKQDAVKLLHSICQEI